MPNDPAPATPDETAVKAAELKVRTLTAQKELASLSSPWWRRADPLVLAVIAGILTLLGNMGVAFYNNSASVSQEREKAADDLALEQAKARYNLVLQAMATNDAAIAKRNIHFFIDAGLLADKDCKIRNAIDQDQPVLPSLSGTAPAMAGNLHSAPEIATLYNFPSGFDGRGVTVGIVEFGGAVAQADLAKYFKSLDLPVPDIVPVSVAGAEPKSDPDIDAQVMLDVEIIGAIAPRAHIRVYFAPFTAGNFAQIVTRAVADGVSVLSIGWGKSESRWSDSDIATMNGALAEAAQKRVTVVAAAGDMGATDGERDGRRHVDFPASSPWVLAVGGTALKSEGGHIVSETVWRSSPDSATGGGVSEKFPRPDWQSGVAVPAREKGETGRGIPDVAASADPALGVAIVVHDKSIAIGGTSAAVPLWAGLIARINQALGYSAGYLNPALYQGIGPDHVLHAITSGDNGVTGVAGYSAGPGWSAVAGWGSPDGTKLLDWLRVHPNLPADAKTAAATCRASLE
jgi:kumamolisin